MANGARVVPANIETIAQIVGLHDQTIETHAKAIIDLADQERGRVSKLERAFQDIRIAQKTGFTASVVTICVGVLNALILYGLYGYLDKVRGQ